MTELLDKDSNASQPIGGGIVKDISKLIGSGNLCHDYDDLRIKSSGNVGPGTTQPNQKLYIEK